MCNMLEFNEAECGINKLETNRDAGPWIKNNYPRYVEKLKARKS